MGKHLVATIDPDTAVFNEHEAVSAVVDMSSFVEIEGAIHEIDRRCQVTEGSQAERVLDEFVKEARRVARSKFVGLIMGRGREEKATPLNERGLLSVLDHSQELLEFVSKLSLATSAGVLTMEQASNLVNLPFEEFEDKLELVQRLSASKLGFESFFKGNEYLYGSRI